MLSVFFVGLTITGFLGTYIFHNKFSLLERIALGYALGIGFITLLMFYVSLIGGHFSSLFVWTTLIVTLSYTIIHLTYCKKGKNIQKDIIKTWENSKDAVSNSGYLKKSIFIIILIGIVYYVLGNLAKSLYFPVSLWDALTSFDYNARLFQEIQNITEAASMHGGIQKYPLFVPLSNALVYILGGTNPHFVYSLLYISLGMLFYKSLRNYVSPLTALLFTFIILSNYFIRFYSTESYTNFPLAFFYGIGVIHIYNFIALDRKDYFWSGSLLVGLSYWVRPESQYFLEATFVIFLIYCIWKRKRIIYPFIMLLIFYAIGKPWEWYYSSVIENITVPPVIKETSYAFPSINYEAEIAAATPKENLLYNIDHIKFVLEYIYGAFNASLGRNYFILLFIAFIVHASQLFKKHAVMLILLLVHIGIIAGGTWLFSVSASYFAAIQDSAARLSMIITPLVVFYCGLVLDNNDEKRTATVPHTEEKEGEE